MLGRHSRCHLADGGDLGGKAGQEAPQFARQVGTFLGAHCFERADGQTGCLGQGHGIGLRRGRRLARGGRVEAHEIGEGRRAGDLEVALDRGNFPVEASEECRVEERTGFLSGRNGGGHGGAAAGHGRRDDFAQDVFLHGEFARQVEDEFRVAAVDRADLHRIARAAADALSASETGHAFHQSK